MAGRPRQRACFLMRLIFCKPGTYRCRRTKSALGQGRTVLAKRRCISRHARRLGRGADPSATGRGSVGASLMLDNIF